jgi:hypothetical protein
VRWGRSRRGKMKCNETGRVRPARATIILWATLKPYMGPQSKYFSFSPKEEAGRRRRL